MLRARQFHKLCCESCPAGESNLSCISPAPSAEAFVLVALLITVDLWPSLDRWCDNLRNI